MFRRILIANRGEIAVRIMHTLKKMGRETVAVFSEQDRDALHVRMAGMACLMKGEQLTETYLNAGSIIEIARQTGADAIHPGYGFLSENAGFAEKVAAAGIVFIGPSPEVIRLMGSKTLARQRWQPPGSRSAKASEAVLPRSGKPWRMSASCHFR